MANKNFFYYCCARDARLFGSSSLWLAFRYMSGPLLGSILLLLLSAAPAGALHAETLDASGLNEVGSGHLLMRDEVSGHSVPAVVQRSKVHFDVSGMIATVRVEQTFRNDTDHYLEGVYVFPLPDDAAVRYLEMQLGDRRIVGVIQEKAEAKKIYQAA